MIYTHIHFIDTYLGNFSCDGQNIFSPFILYYFDDEKKNLSHYNNMFVSNMMQKATVDQMIDFITTIEQIIIPRVALKIPMTSRDCK